MSEITITLTCSERQMLLIVSVAWKKASSFLLKTGAKIISDPKLKNVFYHFLFIRPFGQMFIGQRFCFLTARADFFSVYDKKIFFLHLEKSSPLTNGLSGPIFQHYCQTQQMTNTKPVTENFGSSVVLMIFRRSEADNTENTLHRKNFH